VAALSGVVLIAAAIGGFLGRDSIKQLFSKQRSGTSAAAPLVSPPASLPSSSPTPAPSQAIAPAQSPAPSPTQTQTVAPSPKPEPVRPFKPAPEPFQTSKPVQTIASPPPVISAPSPAPQPDLTPAPAPTQVSTPKLAPAVQRGIIQWSGEVKKDQLVVIEGGTASVGTVTGRLPRSPCTVVVQPSDVSVAAAPAPSNGYDRIVLRFPKKDRFAVTITWELLH
jgi:hypothetical protein